MNKVITASKVDSNRRPIHSFSLLCLVLLVSADVVYGQWSNQHIFAGRDSDLNAMIGTSGFESTVKFYREVEPVWGQYHFARDSRYDRRNTLQAADGFHLAVLKRPELHGKPQDNKNRLFEFGWWANGDPVVYDDVHHTRGKFTVGEFVIPAEEQGVPIKVSLVLSPTPDFAGKTHRFTQRDLAANPEEYRLLLSEFAAHERWSLRQAEDFINTALELAETGSLSPAVIDRLDRFSKADWEIWELEKNAPNHQRPRERVVTLLNKKPHFSVRERAAVAHWKASGRDLNLLSHFYTANPDYGPLRKYTGNLKLVAQSLGPFRIDLANELLALEKEFGHRGPVRPVVKDRDRQVNYKDFTETLLEHWIGYDKPRDAAAWIDLLEPGSWARRDCARLLAKQMIEAATQHENVRVEPLAQTLKSFASLDVRWAVASAFCEEFKDVSRNVSAPPSVDLTPLIAVLASPNPTNKKLVPQDKEAVYFSAATWWCLAHYGQTKVLQDMIRYHGTVNTPSLLILCAAATGVSPDQSAVIAKNLPDRSLNNVHESALPDRMEPAEQLALTRALLVAGVDIASDIYLTGKLVESPGGIDRKTMDAIFRSKSGKSVFWNRRLYDACTLSNDKTRYHIVKYLLDSGVDPNGFDKKRSNGEKNVPLLIALNRGHIDTAKILLQNGADLDLVTGDHTPPWIPAGQPESVRLMAAHGFDLNMQLPNGKTLLTDIGDDRSGTPYSHRAVTLLEAGAHPNWADGRGTLPVHVAAQHSTKVLKVLIEQGADINQKDRARLTPLHHALQNKECDMDRIKTLLSLGADPNIPDPEGNIYLHSFADFISRHREILLQRHGSHRWPIDLHSAVDGGLPINPWLKNDRGVPGIIAVLDQAQFFFPEAEQLPVDLVKRIYRKTRIRAKGHRYPEAGIRSLRNLLEYE